MRKIFKTLLLITVILIFSVPVFSEVKKYDLNLYVGETVQLYTLLINGDTIAPDEQISWNLGNRKVAKVYDNGDITGLEDGHVTIYVKSEERSKRVAIVRVNVISVVNDFELKDDEITISPDEFYNLEYKVYSKGDNDKLYNSDIKWSSGNPHIVEVDRNGQIKGVKEGKARITATVVDGNIRDSVLVYVKGESKQIEIDKNNHLLKMYVGETHQFKAMLNGKDVTQKVEWESSRNGVIKIDKNKGFATALKSGFSKVKAMTNDESKTSYISINVISMVKDIQLMRDGKKIEENLIEMDRIGQKIDLDYKIIPKKEGVYPFEDGVKWSSLNPNIVYVNSDGVITAKRKGVTLISVTTNDGEKVDNISVEVLGDGSKNQKNIPLDSIKLVNPIEELVAGEKYELPIEFYPQNATNKKLILIADESDKCKFEYIDDKYYFTPTKEGENRITIKSYVKDVDKVKYNFRVISPFKSVKIDTQNLKQNAGEYVLYEGQSLNIKPNVDFKFANEDKSLKGVNLLSSDLSVLDVERDTLTGEFRVKSKNAGKARLELKNEYNFDSDNINFIVLNPFKILRVNAEINKKVGDRFKPDFDVVIKPDLEYPLVIGENLDLSGDITITKQYFLREEIEKEIEFLDRILDEFKKIEITSENSKIVYGEINKYTSLKQKFKLLLKSSEDKYLLIRDDLKLGENYRVASVEDGYINAMRKGKIDIEIDVAGRTLHANYYIDGDTKDDSIFSADMIVEERLADKVELIKAISTRYGNRKSEDIPNQKYLEAILELENMGLVPSHLQSKYRQDVNRLEMAETLVKILEYVDGEKIIVDNSESKFLDTTSCYADIVCDLRIMDVKYLQKFKPYDKINIVDFAVGIDRMIESAKNNKEKMILKNDKSQNVYYDENGLSDKQKSALKKYAKDYGLIEPINNKIDPYDSLNREEFLYYIYKLVN